MKPLPAVDTIIESGGKILLLKRAIHPFIGRWVLPGGKVDYGETAEKAAVRETLEETGLRVRLKEILGVYSDIKRDPRAHSLSTVFVAGIAGGSVVINSESSAYGWFYPKEAAKKSLGFDHKKILADYLKWRVNKRGTFWSSR